MGGTATDDKTPARTKDDRREVVLAALRHGWSLSHAAREAGESPSTVRKWRAASETFARAVADAIEEGTDLLEDVAMHRAMHGHERPLMYQGRQVGTEHVPSDRLAELMLRSRRPDRYRDRATLEVTDSGRPTAGRLSANRSAAADGATADAFATVARAAREREQEDGGR
jgi:lambda repressor-like predicted transcriptional regulator